VDHHGALPVIKSPTGSHYSREKIANPRPNKAALVCSYFPAIVERFEPMLIEIFTLSCFLCYWGASSPLYIYLCVLIFHQNLPLTPNGPMTILRPFLKFGQAIVKDIFIKNSWIKLWIGGLVLASRRTKFYKIPVFGLVFMSQNVFFFSIWAAKKLFIIKFV
jgi:hypothetical protein